jgi:hypothetical protein
MRLAPTSLPAWRRQWTDLPDDARGAFRMPRHPRPPRHRRRGERAGTLEYAKLPFAALYGIALFAEVPDSYTLLGAALIVLSTLYIGRREAQLGKRPAVPRANPEV